MAKNVCVIGTIFVDCKGFAADCYHPFGRNLGSIKFVHGGVGRNVAENLANLSLATTLVSSVDATGIGKEVVERLNGVGVNTGLILQTAENGMGMWLAILDEKGELAGSISHMPELKLLESLIYDKGEQIVQNYSDIVLEIDLNEAIAGHTIELAKRYQKAVYGIPGNMDVISKHKDLLADLECFICNNFEADRILEADFSGLSIEKMKETLCTYVNSTGMRCMVITLGEKGCVYYDSSTVESGYQPAIPVDVVDSSGAGDAFFSGTVAGLIKGLSLSKAVISGTKVAAWTIEHAENTCCELPRKIREDEFFQGAFVV